MKSSWGLLALVLGAVIPAAAGDWPQWRGPDRDGISRETGWRSDWGAEDRPKILWEAKVGIGFSSFAVSEGRVFTLGNDSDTDTLWCFEAATGKVLWAHHYPMPLDALYFEGGPVSTPVVEGGRVFAIGKRGLVHCLNAADGSVVWSTQIAEGEGGSRMPTWGFSGSPVVQGDRVLINAGAFGLALQKADGSLLWRSEGASEAGYSSPLPAVIEGAAVAIFSNTKAWVAADPATGQEKWRHRWLTRYGVNAADPIIQGQEMFISSGYDKGAALLKISASGAEVVWQNKEMRNMMNPCLLIDGKLYGIDGNEGDGAGLKCLDWKTGAALWKDDRVGAGTVIGASGGEKLIVLTEKGELLFAPADPSGFKPGRGFSILSGKCWTVPVLSDARLFARNAEGRVVCVDLSLP